MCTYCNISGHMVDTCYKKHGYPPHLHRGGAINQYSMDDQEIEDNLQSLGQKEVSADGSSVTFTPEQHKALISLLQQTSQASPSHTTNQLVSFHKNGNSGIFCATLHAYSSNINSWVLNSGATDHVCFSQTQFQCLKQIRPILVKLPDGSQIQTNLAGTIHFNDQLYLIDVLYIPSFTFNLILVSRLIANLHCSLNFHPTSCSIQDNSSLRTIGAT